MTAEPWKGTHRSECPTLRSSKASCTCATRQNRTENGTDLAQPASLIVELPWPKPPLTGNRTRGNPYARANEVKRAKAEALPAIDAALRGGKVWPVVGADVHLHYRPSTRHRRDADGLYPTLKVCQDALVTLGVLPDDSWIHVPAATCRIHPPVKSEPAAMWLELTVLTEYEPGAHP